MRLDEEAEMSLPADPLAVAQPYLLYEVGCNTNPLPRIRWRECDRGEPVDFEPSNPAPAITDAKAFACNP